MEKNLPQVRNVLTAAALRALVPSPAYRRHLACFVAWAGSRPITAPVLVEYLKHIEAGPEAASTKVVRRYAVLAALKVAASRLPVADAVEARARLAELAKRVPVSKRRPLAVTSSKIIDATEYGKILAAVRNPRVKAILGFLWETGARAGELCSIRLKRCRVVGEYVHVTVLGKGRKERELPISRALFDEIRAAFGGSTWLFENHQGNPIDPVYVTHRITEAGEAARLGKRISAHTLRHSYASHMVGLHPGQIDAVSRHLGHASVSTTVNFYVHSQLDDGALVRGGN